MSTPQEDPNRYDPTNQSGRPLIVAGMMVLALVVLGILLVIGVALL